VVPPGPPAEPPKSHLTFKLRSFFLVLAWVSAEQPIFDALAARAGFLEQLPPSQRQPVLRLRWDAAREGLEPPLVALDYGGQLYAVSDVRGQSWNRDVFTLLSYIQSQISLDPKTLPVQQIITVQ
jgi:hypothetical protein